MNGLLVQRHVTEGKNKDIVHVQIQNLNLQEEVAMEGVGKSSIAIKMNVLLHVSKVLPFRVQSKSKIIAHEFKLILYDLHI